ncbi:MAG: sulfatase-like hydrolase/transferase [Verrucomicrobiota bacterium]|nr:sulfatase-like hydrolase/transferase [Verrucomicrobiota bacterium]
MNRRKFIKTSLITGAASAAILPSMTALSEQPQADAPTSEWARNRERVPSSEHPALRKANEARRAEDTRPNILLIYTDQQTINALSCAGNPWVRTPNMDALARRGVRFEHSYCPAPICGPSRSCLTYGRMPHETGVRYNSESPHESLPNIGTALRDAGYDTTWAGKWHLPDSYPPAGAIPGFHYLRHPVGTLGDFLGDAVDMHYAQAAGHYLRWHAGLSSKPWFLGVSFHNPHDICHYFLDESVGMPERDADVIGAEGLPPLPANHEVDPHEPELLVNRRKQMKYAAEIGKHGDLSPTHWRAYLQTYYHMTQTVDRCLTPILEGLDAGGWAKNTLIVFTSDHGEGMAAHRWFTKLSLYQETVKVPFIALLPGEITNGKGRVDRDHLVSGLDLFPTCLDYAGVPADKWPAGLRGLSLRNLFEQKEAQGWREYIVTAVDFDPARPDEVGRMIVTADGWKYCAYSKGANPETLFNLNVDPGEMNNLVKDAACIAQLGRLRGLLQDWVKKTADPFAIQ